jgi:hypothetical protein
MILFDNIVQVLDLPQFTPFWNGSFRLQFALGLWIGGVFIDGDHARSGGMRRSQRFREEAFGRLRIACRAQEELERVADAESTARYRYIQVFLIFTYVSSTRQESLVALRCGLHRFSSSGA